ncbi:MAG: ABC transporter ATP-binding protein [Hyphomicrobiaceae bacterium]
MLVIDRVSHSFGALKALQDVSLSLETGEMLGLIGPNGSGKSTLLNVLTGLYAPEAGRLIFDGIEVGGWPPHQIAALGIARTFQTPRLYQRMTVRENIEAAQVATGPGTRGTDAPPITVDALIGKAGLADRAASLAESLSLPEQRRLELVRTQAANPKLVLLDEPAGGMTPAETADMARLIQSLVCPGQCWIVIEHKMDLISALCRRLVVLNFGQVICDGPRAEVFKHPAVIEAYLGPGEEG